MKKFYAFAAAAVATMSMNAQLYVCGNGEGLAWEPATPMVVEATDGAYTFEIKNLVEFKISSASGDWGTFNNGSYFATITEETLGTAVALESMAGVDNPANISAPWKGDYKIVVAGDYSTITMTTTTPKPDPTAEKAVYVRGSFDSSWAALPEWKFSKVEGNTYALECSLPMGTEFKIADADWGAINYGAGDQVFADTDDMWNYNADNSTMAEDFNGTITITLPEVEREPAHVVFTEGAGVGNVAAENAPAEYFNLQGVRVENPANGLYIVRQGSKVSKQLVK